MSAPARFPNGVTDNAANDPLRMMGQMDPTNFHTYFNDFDHFNASDWTITTTEAGAGSATEALTNADGGVLLITNDDADNDNDWLQKVGESFKFESGKKLFFKSRFKISDATQSQIIMGLQITDTSPTVVTDGVYFETGDDVATMDFYVEKNSTATTASSIATLADNTYITVGFYYNGVDAVEYSTDGVKRGELATTNLPDDEELTISFGIQNGEAAAKTMSVDYIFVAKER